MGKASRARREKIRPILEARETEGLVKRARFYDALHSFRAWTWYEDDVDWSITIPFRDDLDGYVVFDAQPIYDYVVSHSDFYRDWLNGLRIADAEWLPQQVVRIPYSSMFCEYKTEDYWHGFAVHSFQVDETNKVHVSFLHYESSIEEFNNTLSRPLGNKPPHPSTTSWFPSDFSDDGGISIFEPKELYETDVDDNGQIIDGISRESIGRRFRMTFDVDLYIVLTAITFMNYRNAELIDIAPSPDDSAAYECKFGVPMTKYQVLRVNPIGKRYAREDKPQQQFDIMPLHLVRGHERDSSDHPLPQFRGKFWIPAHARGNAKNGMVVKDYKVTP